MKVGDKARVNCSQPSCIQQGKVVTVTDVKENSFSVSTVSADGRNLVHHRNDLTPVKEYIGADGSLTVSETRVTDPVTGGQKGSKPERFDLLPWDALQEVARVYAFGSTKYDDHNWLKGYKWSLSFAALFRHAAQLMLGEDRDKESGCLHSAHIVWHGLTLTTFLLRKLGTDDRVKP